MPVHSCRENSRKMSRKAKKAMDSGVPAERIASLIHFLRGQKAMLDADLAELYDVSTSALIQSVKRNRSRFPSDFMFQINKREMRRLC
jgi:hypothetical protein